MISVSLKDLLSRPLMPVFQSLRLAKLAEVLMKKEARPREKPAEWFSLYISMNVFSCWRSKPDMEKNRQLGLHLASYHFPHEYHALCEHIL